MSEPVEVRILDRGFTVGVEPAEKDSLMQAASFLDARMREVRGNNRSAALERVAVLTALNLAAELLQAKKAGGSNDQALSRALGDMNRPNPRSARRERGRLAQAPAAAWRGRGPPACFLRRAGANSLTPSKYHTRRVRPLGE